MSTRDGSPTPARHGRMNRSRLIAAGTSVGALIAITAGVAAANPAPSTKPDANADRHTAQTNPRDQSRSSDQSGDQGGSLRGDDDGWRQLPPDPSASDPGLSRGTDTGSSDFGQPQPFDPGPSSGGSNTSSGGS